MAVLRDLGDRSPTEVELRDALHERLSGTPDASSEGWYIPPPHGIIVAIANPPGYERVNQPTFRAQEAWPSSQHRLSEESILYAYSSRVHLPSGVIGDTGCSLYRGSDPRIHTHFRNVWEVTQRIVAEVELGMTFADLYQHATKLISEHNLTNNVYSSYSPANTNIGHTIPWSNVPISQHDQAIVSRGTPEELALLVRDGRQFLDATEPLEITDGLAFTVEPRLSAPGLPSVGFHIVTGFENGERAVITEFEPLLDLFGMDLRVAEWVFE